MSVVISLFNTLLFDCNIPIDVVIKSVSFCFNALIPTTKPSSPFTPAFNSCAPLYNATAFCGSAPSFELRSPTPSLTLFAPSTICLLDSFSVSAFAYTVSNLSNISKSLKSTIFAVT